jgi:hydroxyacylglutathione hydrolase
LRRLKMRVSIHPIGLVDSVCYLIRSERSILIDTGVPGKAKGIVQALESLAVQPEEIPLILITHGHWDHMGSAKAIKEITGGKIAMHEREKDRLEKSLKLLPRGVTLWGRIIMGLAAMRIASVDIPATDVDVVLGDEEFSLAEYGVPGKVLYTPGHTMGSVSVLLETGDAIVGDLAMNGPPMRIGPGLPIVAEDMPRVKESWKLLLEEGAERIYPGHGKPFSAEVIRRALS